jgi:3-phosphoshikimate 1-carboxyvinyltransferase
MAERTVIELPGDKSLTHRALLLAALACGESTIEHPLTSLDVRSMAAALRRLGVAVSPLRGRLRVRGGGLAGLTKPEGGLHCGNSGTAARFLLGVLAACPFTARVTGDRSLRGRPMRRVTHPLQQMGATFVELGGDGLPLEVRGGALRSIDYATETASAQVKSAILFAGLVAGVAVSVTEPFLSRDHTERMLRALGASVIVDDTTVRFKPVDEIPSFDATIPGDPSSAAFLVAAALLAGTGEVTLRNMLVNPTRLGFVQVLRRMGADIEIREFSECLGEPVGEVLVRASDLWGTEVHAHEVPSLIDEIPVLAVVATAAAGQTTFKGVSELRVKESDRLNLLAANLTSVGAECRAEDETLQVSGMSKPPRGAVETGFDHRMAMAFAVMGRMRGGSVELSEDRSPQVSYPGFFKDLDRVVTRG